MYYIILIFLIRFIISFICSKKKGSIDRKKALYLYWFILLFCNIFYCYPILRIVDDDIITTVVALISFIMSFRLYIDFKDSYKEENQKRAKYMVKGLIPAFILYIIFEIKTYITLSMFYMQTACMGYIFGIILGILLMGFAKIVEFFSKNEDRIKKKGKEVATTAKNEISKIGSKTEYEVNVFESEELKVETKIDKENLTIEENVEYERNLLIVVKKKTINLIDRIFNKK